MEPNTEKNQQAEAQETAQETAKTAEATAGKSLSSVGRSQGSALAADGRIPELPKSYD